MDLDIKKEVEQRRSEWLKRSKERYFFFEIYQGWHKDWPEGRTLKIKVDAKTGSYEILSGLLEE